MRILEDYLTIHGFLIKEGNRYTLMPDWRDGDAGEIFSFNGSILRDTSPYGKRYDAVYHRSEHTDMSTMRNYVKSGHQCMNTS